MSEPHQGEQTVNARIVYWGVQGAGITSNLRSIHAKLKASNRGDVRHIATRIDPTVEYEVLPIELGKVNGIRTRLQVIGLPGSPEQAPTRKHLLDQIDGIVFVVDSRLERLSENLESLRELRESLATYGHDPDEIPLVVQYNKCDLVDDIAIERLHREIDVAGTNAFEAAAHDGTGVLKTLTTISKQVIRSLGRRDAAGATQSGAARTPATPAAQPAQPAAQPKPVAAAPARPAKTPTTRTAEPRPVASAPAPRTPTAEPSARKPAPKPPRQSAPAARTAPIAAAAVTVAAPQSGAALMEAAILAEDQVPAEARAADATTHQARSLLDQTWEELSEQNKPEPGARIGADLRIVSVGTAERSGDRGVKLPLVLGSPEGETVTLALTIQLDPLFDDS